MKIVRYFTVGAVAAAVDFVVFALLVKILHWHWFGAAMVGFVIATAVNYILSIRHVFQSGVRFNRGQEIAAVFVVSGVGLAINQLVLYVFIELYRVDELASKLFATAATFLWNYAMRRYFVFSDPRKIAP